MIVLILGLALWVGAHVFKRAAPERRAALQARLGNGSKGVMAGLLLLSVVLIVFGYAWSPFVPVWTPPPGFTHVNNLLMLVAIFLLGLGHSGSRLRRRMRHPMLWGFATWCVAHLLVNGDLASIVMWGVFLVWAFAEMVLINRRVTDYAPYTGGSAKGDIRLVIITVFLYAIIAAIHFWLGVYPFAS